jgi:hypothetical protein
MQQEHEPVRPHVTWNDVEQGVPTDSDVPVENVAQLHCMAAKDPPFVGVSVVDRIQRLFLSRGGRVVVRHLAQNADIDQTTRSPRNYV